MYNENKMIHHALYGTQPMTAFGERVINAIASYYLCFTSNER